MKNIINTNELVEKLNAMLNREEENIKVLNGSNKTFALGYAEAIADVISLLEYDTDETDDYEVVDLGLGNAIAIKVTGDFDDDFFNDLEDNEEEVYVHADRWSDFIKYN